MSDQIRFIYLIKPIAFLIPTVPTPKIPIKKKEKLIWTGMVLFIFLICSQIPLYGVYKSEGTDPLHWMRVILASNRGSLMELGTSPIFTSSMIFQVLSGMRIIEVDINVKEDRKLYKLFIKVFAILIAFGEAIACVFSGTYGDVKLIGSLNCFLLIVQLVTAGILVIILDEVLEKGYGIGSGVSLFIVTNICENILWKALSPFTVSNDNGVEYEGAIIAAVHFLTTKKNKVEAIHRSFYRKRVPNLSSLISTFLFFIIIIYLQGIRKEIKINNKHVPGHYFTQKIKLFYCSNTPIILESALVSNLYFISQILYKRYKSFFLIRLLGQWQDVEGGQSIPIGGLAYYISPPRDLVDFLRDPLHSFFYVLFILISCGLFAKTWVELSGKSARDIARNLRENQYFLEGIRENEENIYEQLNKTIPAAATLGGMSIGALTIFADFMGAIGSGTGILLAVTIIYEYFEDFKKDETQKKLSAQK
jgi:protein transport protein SEC61 subunit alpha